MRQLLTGEFFGHTNRKLTLGHLTVTDTVYTHEHVDWHYHENAYFTFLLQGKVLEFNRKETHLCTPGSLLFHNWQDPHFNKKPPGFTRGFHIEIKQEWFKQYELESGIERGSLNISDPGLVQIMYNLFRETSKPGTDCSLVTDHLLIRFFGEMNGIQSRRAFDEPRWVQLTRQLLRDDPFSTWSLTEIATLAEVHPVHLSRSFKSYFGCNLAQYLRNAKLTHSLRLLADNSLSLTDIAFECGFADQSHYIREFRKLNKVSPGQFRRLFVQRNRC